MENRECILVGLDTSPLSQKNLNEAIRLAQQRQAELAVVTIINDHEMNEASEEYIATEEFFKLEKERAQKLLQAAKEQLQKAGVKGDTYLEYGSPKKLLATDLPERFGATLIAIGAPDKRLENYFGIGSVASYVIRHASVNIFITKE